MTETEREIRSEIAKAVRQLGASPELVATIEGKTKEEMYNAAERRVPTATYLRPSARGATLRKRTIILGRFAQVRFSGTASRRRIAV